MIKSIGHMEVGLLGAVVAWAWAPLTIATELTWPYRLEIEHSRAKQRTSQKDRKE